MVLNLMNESLLQLPKACHMTFLETIRKLIEHKTKEKSANRQSAISDDFLLLFFQETQSRKL